jgi:hypothetical protein
MEMVLLWLSAIRSWPWPEVKSVAELILYYLTVLAVLACLLRLGAIGRILRDFREARGPLWELINTVKNLRDLEPTIRSLSTQVALVDEKVESARMQVAELQVESISTRSDAEVTDDVDDTDRGDGVDQAAVPDGERAVERIENRNWLILRDYWQRNRKRIEYVIDQIPDRRSKLAYDRLPRTNYNRILNKLQGQDRITAAAGKASRELNALFNRYRPRNKTIPDEVVGSLQVLDSQLERELVPFSKVLAAELGDEQRPPPLGTSSVPAHETVSSRPSVANNLSGHPAT